MFPCFTKYISQNLCRFHDALEKEHYTRLPTDLGSGPDSYPCTE